ncbi:hypothetical protein [Candidatus Clostridium helianthi]|uniref:Phage tail protein n=1 Tax=Candidatus Clostridium helianthi TaxID=3381660 RepID=A0ABW8SBZ0_9CLOT
MNSVNVNDDAFTNLITIGSELGKYAKIISFKKEDYIDGINDLLAKVRVFLDITQNEIIFNIIRVNDTINIVIIKNDLELGIAFAESTTEYIIYAYSTMVNTRIGVQVLYAQNKSYLNLYSGQKHNISPSDIVQKNILDCRLNVYHKTETRTYYYWFRAFDIDIVNLNANHFTGVINFQHKFDSTLYGGKIFVDIKGTTPTILLSGIYTCALDKTIFNIGVVINGDGTLSVYFQNTKTGTNIDWCFEKLPDDIMLVNKIKIYDKHVGQYSIPDGTHGTVLLLN